MVTWDRLACLSRRDDELDLHESLRDGDAFDQLGEHGAASVMRQDGQVRTQLGGGLLQVRHPRPVRDPRPDLDELVVDEFPGLGRSLELGPRSGGIPDALPEAIAHTRVLGVQLREAPLQLGDPQLRLIGVMALGLDRGERGHRILQEGLHDRPDDPL